MIFPLRGIEKVMKKVSDGWHLTRDCSMLLKSDGEISACIYIHGQTTNALIRKKNMAGKDLHE